VIYFLLPAYNEENDLPKVLQAVSGVKFPDDEFHIVVVDDGSTDRTPAILDEWSAKSPITILTHSPNRGLGRAMSTGMTHLAGRISENDAVVALDSDNTHDPGLAVRMREKQLHDDLDVVIASRYAVEDGEDRGKEVGLAFHRKILSRSASFILDTAFHVPAAQDYTCGFRLYSGRILKKARRIYGEEFVMERNFVCMAEILVKLDHIGAKVGEVPLTLRYDLKGGASKLKIMRTVLQYLDLIWRYKVNHELNKYHGV